MPSMPFIGLEFGLGTGHPTRAVFLSELLSGVTYFVYPQKVHRWQRYVGSRICYICA